MSDKNTILFPHEKMRPIQEEVVKLIFDELKDKQSTIIHAPTGLGKTAASLAPALTLALKENKTVFFLTSKNTQHKIAVETLRKIKDKFDINLKATDIVGKKWMCIQPGIQLLSSTEFNEYCKALREDKKCAYYENVKKGESLTPMSRLAIDQLNLLSPVTVEQIVKVGEKNEVCPYELGMLLAKEANVIVADYYYLFHEKIRENFLKRNNKTLKDSIIIIDEGHNLPNRLKDLATENLSTIILKRAASESKKYGHENVFTIIEKLNNILIKLISNKEDEIYISRESLINEINQITDYNEFVKECYRISEGIREEQKNSFIGSIASFLDAWLGGDVGFTRIMTKKKGYRDEIITISYRCLDPSIVSKEVIQQSAGTILMSGTLTPTQMYSEILGFSKETKQEEFPSPFPQDNRINMIIAQTSTKYTSRGEEQYKKIAKILTDIINNTPGNSAIFFPSYFMKDQIDQYLSKVEKTVFHERREMSKQDKDEMIENFKTYKKTGATLLAVVSGSYGEGIDLPGDELRTVVVVGLPLSRPDLETKALIEYYDLKYKNGWNYGYVFPAFNKVIQNAGRCIRSSNDKGVIIFLDERYTWNQYFRCFPDDWKMKVTVNNYNNEIINFFNKHGLKSDHPKKDDDSLNNLKQMTL